MVAVTSGGVDVSEDALVGVGFDGGEGDARAGGAGHVEAVVVRGRGGGGDIGRELVGDLVEDENLGHGFVGKRNGELSLWFFRFNSGTKRVLECGGDARYNMDDMVQGKRPLGEAAD